MLLEANTLVGNYKVLRRLGSGGMADVYEAEDQTLGRRVALKVLPAQFARDPDLIARFDKEVRAAASLNHHGIVTVFEVGHKEGIHYYSMRLLIGGDLRSRMDKGLSQLEALAILREVADAFSHAHTRGFVHRDVKPENIIFDEQGYPVLTDFGIAKALDAGTRMTATGVSIGTPRYISPEQARGRKVDARADLYSLGVILFEMLSGRPPYDAEEALAVIFKHVTEPIPPLPEEHANLQPLVSALMAKEPEQRPASAKDLIRLIDTYLPQQRTEEFRVATAQQNPLIAKLATPRPDAKTVVLVDTPAKGHAQSLAAEVQRQEEARREREAFQQLRPEDEQRRKDEADAAARKEQEEAARVQAEARRRAEEDARAKAEAEARKRADDEQKRRDEDAKRKAEEQARAAAAAEAQRARAEEERRAREQSAREAAEADERRKKEAAQAAERERKQAEERRRADEDAQRKAEQQRLKQEAEAQRRAEERRRADEDAQRKAEAQRLKQEAEAQRKAEKERMRQESEQRKDAEKAAREAERRTRDELARREKQEKEARRKAALASQPPGAQAAAAGMSRARLAMIGGAVLLAIVMAWWLLSPRPAAPPSTAQPAPAAPAPQENTAPAGPTGQDLARQRAIAQEQERQKALAQERERQDALLLKEEKAAADEAARKKTLADQAARERAEREAAAKRQAEQAEAARQKALQDQARQKAADDAARKKALDQEKARQRAQAEAARKKALAAQPQPDAKTQQQLAEEEAARKKAEEEEAKRQERMKRPTGF